ncbi:MAG TPA: MmcQ/YjbR family DNA-binding protein, partial [Gemmatimonadaceae bacterium]|nr:MmcQ/YjbR family DNA-binding protein [Gemmatimonadaceae bacterium]
THHGAGRASVWVKAKGGNQDLLVRADPARYFAPPYVGPKGWIGAYLGRGADWRAVEDLIRDAYRLTAPKTLLKRLHADG